MTTNVWITWNVKLLYPFPVLLQVRKRSKSSISMQTCMGYIFGAQMTAPGVFFGSWCKCKSPHFKIHITERCHWRASTHPPVVINLFHDMLKNKTNTKAGIEKNSLSASLGMNVFNYSHRLVDGHRYVAVPLSKKRLFQRWNMWSLHKNQLDVCCWPEALTLSPSEVTCDPSFTIEDSHSPISRLTLQKTLLHHY